MDMRRNRLNIEGLRDPGPDDGANGSSAQTLTLSRRSVLGAAAAAGVGASPVGRAVAATFHGSFRMLAERKRVAFILGGRTRWTIDTKRFAGSPKLDVVRDHDTIRLELRDALFPGTDISADFACE